MKDYKKKFILSNLIMVGIILIIMNAVIFFYLYNAGKEEPSAPRARKGKALCFRLISRRKLTRYCIENMSRVRYNEVKAFLRGNENV